MKRKILIIIILVILIAAAVGVYWISSRPKSIKIQNMKWFNFCYSVSWMANGNVDYTLEAKDGKYTASIKPDGIAPEDAEYFQVDESFVQKLEKLLNDNEVGKWNGFSKSDKNVLDGNTFSLSINMMDGTYIHASGYMRWPKNYSAVKEGIEALFSELSSSD